MAGRIQQVAVSITAEDQASQWIKHDYFQCPFDVSLSVFYGTGLDATLEVQYIADDMSQSSSRQVLVSRSSTTITVVDDGPPLAYGNGLGHGLLEGDWVVISGSQGGVLDGGYAVASVTNATTYTLTSGTSGTVASSPANLVSGRVFTHATLKSLSARAQDGYGSAPFGNNGPVWASRLYCTAYTDSGVASLVAVQGGNPA